MAFDNRHRGRLATSWQWDEDERGMSQGRKMTRPSPNFQVGEREATCSIGFQNQHQQRLEVARGILQREPQDTNYTSLAEKPEDYLGKEWASE